MKSKLKNGLPLAAVTLLALGANHAVQAAEIAVCTFPGSPSAALDQKVAVAAVERLGDTARVVPEGLGHGRRGDDDLSARQIGKRLEAQCDLVAGLPVPAREQPAEAGLLFSHPYLHAGYVGVQASGASHPKQDGKDEVVAATYASPAQLIVLQQQPHAALHLENTQEATVEAVATGKAARGVAWYPAVVAYKAQHRDAQLTQQRIASPYAKWSLVIAFGARNAALRQRVESALHAMERDGQLAALTHGWDIADAYSMDASRRNAALAERREPAPASPFMRADFVVQGANPGWRGGLMRVAAPTAGTAPATSATGAKEPEKDKTAAAPAGGESGAPQGPSFTTAQTVHGKTIYAAQCAKCHGAELQGVNAPALQGSGFAPAQTSTLTIGGIYGYMSSNMPADRPGKLKPQEYADLMAFLLSRSGYQPGATKLTAAAAQATQTPLVSRPPH